MPPRWPRYIHFRARLIPAKGIYNPPSTQVTPSPPFSQAGGAGAMTPQRTGIHPIEGASQPLGTRVHFHPFAQQWVERGCIPRARYPTPLTGFCTPGVRIDLILGCERWSPETCQPRKQQDGRAKRGPSARREMNWGIAKTCQSMPRNCLEEVKNASDRCVLRETIRLGGIGWNHIPRDIPVGLRPYRAP